MRVQLSTRVPVQLRTRTPVKQSTCVPVQQRTRVPVQLRTRVPVQLRTPGPTVQVVLTRTILWSTVVIIATPGSTSHKPGGLYILHLSCWLCMAIGRYMINIVHNLVLVGIHFILCINVHILNWRNAFYIRMVNWRTPTTKLTRYIPVHLSI